MTNKQINNFFIYSSLSGVSTALLQEQQNIKTGYYQHLIYALLTRRVNTFEGIEQLARQIAAIARQAHLARQMNVVKQASQIMLALPISEELKRIAHYYEALCIKQQGNIEGALLTLEQVAEEATLQYRARALQGIGTTHYERGKFSEALPYYLTAGRIAAYCDPVTLVQSQWMVAVIRSIYGDHKQASDDLENLFPFVCTVSKPYPALYYDYLNSLSVEFSEVGRITEAETAIRIALASPFASAYPEWSETREEVEQKRNYPDSSRCFIDRSLIESEAIPDSDSNLLVEADTSIQPERATETRPVRASKPCCFVGQSIYQRPVTLPNAVKAIIPRGLAQSFLLQRLGRCLQPRAPPTA